MNQPFYDQFWGVINRLVIFSKKEKQLFQEHLTVIEPKAHTVLVDLEEVATSAYFVLKGCVRFYYITEDGREITGFVFTENMFASSHNSFFNQSPSLQVVETLEPCTLLQLSYESLNRLYEEVPKTNILVRKVLQERFSHAQQVVEALISMRPEERYRHLLETRPDLVNRVPQHILASYIGITPVSLSRIRSRRR